MNTRMASTIRLSLLRLACGAALVLALALLCRAGGPKNVAGTSYFDPSVAGQPLVWPQGTITYFTDLGDLSPILPNAAANSFVATAFSQWTAVPTEPWQHPAATNSPKTSMAAMSQLIP